MSRTSPTYKKKLDFLESYARLNNYELHISEKGNPYIYLDDEAIAHRVYSAQTVTKATVHKIGQPYEYPNSDRTMILLTDNSKFLYYNRYQWASPSKEATPQFYYFNRKCSWLLSVPSLRSFRICEQFSSLTEFKNYLDLNFLIDREFISTFSTYSEQILRDLRLSNLRKKYLIYEIYPALNREF